MTPCIAIITPYTLVAMGLKGVLEDMFPSAKVLTFQSLPEKDLVAGILRLHESVHPHTAAMPSHSQQPLVEMLSKREREVLTLMVKGLLNKEIADNTNISVTTVIFHRNNICRKFGTRSIGHLAIKAVLAGLVDVNEI